MREYLIMLGQRILHRSSIEKRALWWLRHKAPLGASVTVVYPVYNGGLDAS